MLNLDLRTMLTRRLGIKRCVFSDEEVVEVTSQVREHIHQLLR